MFCNQRVRKVIYQFQCHVNVSVTRVSSSHVTIHSLNHKLEHLQFLMFLINRLYIKHIYDVVLMGPLVPNTISSVIVPYV